MPTQCVFLKASANSLARGFARLMAMHALHAMPRRIASIPISR